MEDEVFKLVIIQSIFAVLFCYLLFYILKENSKRENNYQKIIKNLSDSLPIIKKDVNDIMKNLINHD